MEYSLHIEDGSNTGWVFRVTTRPDLIGHSYYISGVKALLLDSALDEKDLHYAGIPGFKLKPSIPKGTEVEIKSYFFNFYGAYFSVVYEGKQYDIATNYIKLIRKS